MKLKIWISRFLILIACHQTCLADSAVQGVRFGGQVGYGLLDTRVRISRVDQPVASDSSDISGRGVLGGFVLEWGNVVGSTDMYLGVEGAFTVSTTKGKKSTLGTFPATGADEDLTTSVFFKRCFDLAGKMGFLLRDVALPYVKLGLTSGHWKASSVSNAANASGNQATTSLGVIIGLGADFPVTERLAWGLGYDYRYYKNFTHYLKDNVSGAFLRRMVVSPTAHAVMFRLTWKLTCPDFSTSTPPKERKRKRFKKPKPEN